MIDFLDSRMESNFDNQLSMAMDAEWNKLVAQSQPGLSISEMIQHVYNHPLEPPRGFLIEVYDEKKAWKQKIRERNSTVPFCIEVDASSDGDVSFDAPQTGILPWNATYLHQTINQTTKPKLRILTPTPNRSNDFAYGAARGQPSFGDILEGIQSSKFQLHQHSRFFYHVPWWAYALHRKSET
jgi:hypothetical protein